MAKALNDAFQRQGGNAALALADVGNDFATVFSRIASLAEEARNELSRASFTSEERRVDMTERIETTQRALLNALVTRGSGNSRGALLSEAQLERLSSVVEQIEEKGVCSGTLPDRNEMMRETEALIAEVKTWDMDEYAQRTLLIQLNCIERVIQTADLYSAAELRGKVKSVIADFAAEFSAHDKHYQTRMEKLLSWARKAFFPGSIMLSLAADTSTVVALLPGPSG